MYEDRPEELLRDMAHKKVLVEINLTSNRDSLDVSGKHHPLLTYRKFGVPIALSTDDEGIERIDLSHEYVRAVQSYDLTYADLKQIVRASLEHSFLPGASLWQERDVFTTTVPDCRGDMATGDQPGASCATFLKASEKATQQWELERRFGAFEAAF
jgi:adenosine deaminase